MSVYKVSLRFAMSVYFWVRDVYIFLTYKLGVFDYLAKPIDLKTMVNVIEKALCGFNETDR